MNNIDFRFHMSDVRASNRGQVALIVLLISAVALTLGLVTSKQATMETKIDTQEEQLQRAFNAAESGLESYLSNSSISSYTSSDNKATAQIQTTAIGNTTTIDSEGLVLTNKPMVFWLMGHTSDGKSLDQSVFYPGATAALCSGNGEIGSLKVSFYYLQGTVYHIQRGIYNLSGSGGIANGLAAIGGSCPNGQVQVATISWNAATQKPVAVVAVPLFSPIHMEMTGSSNFPMQGMVVSSTGKDVQGGAQRTVSEEFRWNAGLLDYMLEGMTAEGGINVL